MAFLFHPEFWARWLGIVLIDLSLAGDNALVIAMAVLTLPRREQLIGLVGGTVGAVALRLALIAIITRVLVIPLLQAVGGLVLIWIAVKLVRQDSGEGGKEWGARQVTTLWKAVGIIIVADLIMSLDNVLAVAAAAHGDLVLVMFGIGFSIPIVIWGSSLLARLMARFPWIVWFGGGVLGWVAGELVVRDAVVQSRLRPGFLFLHWALPSVLALALTLLGGLLAWHGRRVSTERERTFGMGS